MQEGDGRIAAGYPDGIAHVEFFNILSVCGKNQFFICVLYGNFDDV
jgi:hypothetical protein